MTMSDPIADMLTRIRNANTAKHDTVDVPSSKMKLAIADILVREGYIKKYDIVEDNGFNTIRIELKYGKDKNEKIISGIKRISKPGLRVYANTEDMPRYSAALESPSFPQTCPVTFICVPFFTLGHPEIKLYSVPAPDRIFNVPVVVFAFPHQFG